MDLLIYKIISLVLILIFSVILSVQDIKGMAVNVYIVCLAILCGVINQLIFARNEIWLYILSSIFMGVFYFVVRKITRGRFGGGDLMYGLFQGIFLKPLFLPLCMIIEVLASLLFLNKKREKAIPFIPFMSSGLLAAWLIQIFISYV